MHVSNFLFQFNDDSLIFIQSGMQPEVRCGYDDLYCFSTFAAFQFVCAIYSISKPYSHKSGYTESKIH